MPSPMIKLKRVYERPEPTDGARILVERLWPRGLSKAAAAVDHWPKEVAPSAPLRKWFAHRSDRWDEFRRRYDAELSDNQAAVAQLRQLCADGRVTFVFAAKDRAQNGAVALRDFLLTQRS